MTEREFEAFRVTPEGYESMRGRGSRKPPVVTARNPKYDPYPSGSIWKRPRGDAADLVFLGFDYIPDTVSQNSRVTAAEENIMFLNPDAAKAYIEETTAAWTGAIRCDTRSGRHLTGNGTVPPRPVPLQLGWSTQPYIGSRPNQSGCVLERVGTDIQLYETQPMHLCDDNVVVSGTIRKAYVGDSIITGGFGPLVPSGPEDGTGGSHGGSRMTAFGGTIRNHELVPGGKIEHAMKLTIDTQWWCSLSPSVGHRWPALVADGGFSGSYGISNPSCPVAAKMGSLWTLDPAFDISSLVTEPARIMAKAYKHYGAYVVDGDAGATTKSLVQWQVERSNEGAFTTAFKNAWGYEFFHRPGAHGAPSAGQLQFRADIGRMMESTYIVNDNARNNIGGAGNRMVPVSGPVGAFV